jgi:hypothetical protein
LRLKLVESPELTSTKYAFDGDGITDVHPAFLTGQTIFFACDLNAPAVFPHFA